MNPKERRPIPACDPYAIDRKGRVFNSSNRKRTTLVNATKAASLWNDYGHASNLRGPGDVTDFATGKTPKGRPIVESSELMNGDHAQWLWHPVDFPGGRARCFPPLNKLDPFGDLKTGWALIRCVGFETLFHAPSMAAYLLANDNHSTQVIDGHSE